MNPQGITIKVSPYTVKETIDHLQAILQSNGVTIYARINQQDELQKTGQVILPLEFILFGNPKSGGPIMVENPMAALDLPLKVIAWQGSDQKVLVAYNSAAYIKERHSLSDHVSAPIDLDPLMIKVLG
ncbi:uncharacterized protein (DUF302 family) [Mucilaginibacter frigoritolerans]|uniref:Uncharacterized protein (DUF302 family) n=1 Tax=Mucilaginibacter frigoritolerans TaxID=652788 RepID=A0A562U3F2_9SPHI|nr:DUF302 domain-containing protein [Mucilaginibacter frigoritolerans]TWJ00099.1 uncharacterized protein (DUF302 family) [Mucilaginibacter frigoritolerans]